jgi:hypothetical protein
MRFALLPEYDLVQADSIFRVVFKRRSVGGGRRANRSRLLSSEGSIVLESSIAVCRRSRR